MSETYAIKTGRHFTPVTVDPDRGQVSVPHENPRCGALVFEGLTDAVILRAAFDRAGVAYHTLRELMFNHPQAVRRRDLDC